LEQLGSHSTGSGFLEVLSFCLDILAALFSAVVADEARQTVAGSKEMNAEQKQRERESDTANC
jgi:hypothetical protein